jgi:arginine decarboxylase
MSAELPDPVTTPAAAYEQLVDVTFDLVGVDELAGRISAAMIVPDPPGIAVMMPGERFPSADIALLRYLTASQDLDAGFETEIDGIHLERDGSYRLPCLSSNTP